MTATSASDCSMLSKHVASIHDALDKPPAEGGSPRRVFDDAERDLRAAAAGAGPTREIAIGYADLLRDFVAVIDRAHGELADLRKRSEALHATTRPAVAAFKKHCPRPDDDEEATDCARVRALLEASSRQEPDCVRCIEQLADRLQALTVKDADIERVKPDLVQAIRNAASSESMFGAARAEGTRHLEAFAAREADLLRRGRAACPAADLSPIFTDPAAPPKRR